MSSEETPSLQSPPHGSRESAQTKSTPAETPSGVASALAAVDAWFESHANLAAGAVLAIGFALRLRAAMDTYLNPDEALHFGLVNQVSLGEAYRQSLTNAHPPLMFFVLYFWRFLGDSEVMLRLPSVLTNTAAVWMLFQWVRLALGTSAGFVALILGAFSPPWVGLSAEVRQYSILLACLASALYFLERAFRDKSAGAMALSAVSLYLGILTNYSALWFTGALGIYGLLRIRDLPVKVAATWFASQIGGALVYVFLYFTHLSKLQGSAMEADAFAGWLRQFYFHPEAESLIEYLHHTTSSFFGYFLSLPGGGFFIAVLFLGGVLWLTSGSYRPGTDPKSRHVPWQFGILLLLPFLLNSMAGLVGRFPYGGTRHCVYLSLFAMAGISALLGKAATGKVWPVWIAAIVFVPTWQRVAIPLPQQMLAGAQDVGLMRDAIAYLRSSVPADGYIFTDGQAGSLLDYYLGRSQVGATRKDCGEFRQMQYGPYKLVSYYNWGLPPEMLAQRVSEWRSVCNVSVESVWVFDGGWDQNVLHRLRGIKPAWYSKERQFGEALSVFEYARPPVGP